MSDIDPLVDALDELTTRLAPAQRLKLSRTIATDLRRESARRIRANVEPDGSPMEARKRKPVRGQGRRQVRSDPMFKRAGGATYLRRKSTAEKTEVGFNGAMARIMAVHQYGERDSVERRAGAPVVTYPSRVVLGLTPDDRLRILDQVTQLLAS